MYLLVPLISVVAIWWTGTGIVLYLQQRLNLPPSRLAWLLALVAILCLALLKITSNGLASWQSYVGFTAAVALWGCIELSYYSGLISGIHQKSCPEHCNTIQRFRLALGASLWHELSVLFVGVLIIFLLKGAPNAAGWQAFLVLWFMRWSAKLNLFFGVPNFSTDWFPERLAYAHSYIRRAPVSIFYFASVGLACWVAWSLLEHAQQLGKPEALALHLPAVLLLLAILEHVFMALPLADNKLWNRIFSQSEEAASSLQPKAAAPDSSKALSTPVTDPITVSVVRAPYTVGRRLEQPAASNTLTP